MKSKKSVRRQAAKLRRDARKLKKLGLVKYDARKKPGRAQKNAVKKFKDVLENKASVVKVANKKEAKKYGRSFRAVGNRVIVPRKKGDRVSYNKKSHEIHISGKRYGKRAHIILEPGRGTKKRKGPKRGFRRWYAIPFGNSKQYFKTKKDLAEFMQEYKETAIANGRKWGFKNWRKYIEIVDLEADEIPGEDF